ncbi:HET-domain-containing protein [Nemania serpens]|nr:HET-domain-containing protein [Nemania serpens]
MALDVLTEPSTNHWLESRRKASQNLEEAERYGDAKRWREQRTAFPFYTSSSPHTCSHCRGIIIDLADHGEESKTRLPYDLPQSVLAAKSGCALYQAFVDLVFNSLHGKKGEAWLENATLSYWILYIPEALPYDTARLQFRIVACSADTGTEDVVGFDTYTVWALEGNPAEIPISTRPYELDYRSSASIDWGRNSIRYCQLNHTECRATVGDDESKNNISPASIPSRLLRLYQNEDSTLHAQIVGRDMEYHIPTSEVSRKGFAILSYCWGGSQPIQLTRATLALGQGYPITILPKTLADAAWFTHQTGLEYLWIDALCIFQDDADDKGREIPRMRQYYGDATVTLCAASAETCSSGFLIDPPPPEDPTNYVFGPVELGVKTTSGEMSTIQAVKEADYFNLHREREPIVRRGWTLQESLLSRRMLIFSSHHLYFTCRVANASCGGREPLLKSRVIGMYQSRVPGIHTISSLQRLFPVVSTWDKVVYEYTQRLLGFPEDKLLAISAMAASLVRTAKEERALEFRYCAGMMFDLEGKDWGWKGELLWTVTQPATPLGTDVLSSPPSWSWASLQAPIHRWQARVDNFPDEDSIRLLDLNAPLADERNPFGAVNGGVIRLMARTRSLSTIDRAECNVAVTRNTVLKEKAFDDSTRSALVLRPDTMEVDDMIASGGERILLVELIATRSNSNLSPYYPAGLLIVRLNGNSDKEDRYRRVGIFEVTFQHHLKSKAQKELVLKQAEALFNKSELRELCIV